MGMLINIVTVDQGAAPTYLHDCENCTFLGFAELDGKFVDLYAHRRNLHIEYIVRHSDEASNYGCFDSDLVGILKERSPYHQIADIFAEYEQKHGKQVPNPQAYEEQHDIEPSFKDFVMAGNAIFTVHNNKGEHYTYRICKNDEKGTWGIKWFVQLLTGPNNLRDYQYLGVLETNSGTIRTTKASKLLPDSKPIKVIDWALGKIVWPKCWNKLPDGYGILHEGKCGRCGRKLTTPESIKIGIGPECLKKMGF